MRKTVKPAAVKREMLKPNPACLPIIDDGYRLQAADCRIYNYNNVK